MDNFGIMYYIVKVIYGYIWLAFPYSLSLSLRMLDKKSQANSIFSEPGLSIDGEPI